MTENICPHCGKSIYDDEAVFCLFCGEGLEQDSGFLGRVKNIGSKLIILTVAVIFAVSFIIWWTR